MTLIANIPASASGLAVLVNSALRAIALGSVAAVALAAFRVKSTPVRLFTWTAVLYGALAMPFLQWMLPSLSISVPVAF